MNLRIQTHALLLLVAMSASACGAEPQQDGETNISKSAITYGMPDGTGHRYVADIVFRDSLSDPWQSGCSGTLVAPGVVITAAHCGVLYLGRDHGLVGVTFAPVLDSSSPIIVGEFIPHPAYSFDDWQLHDNAVVVLDEDVEDVEPARLPPIGLLDTLAAEGLLAESTFDSVGYGVIEPADPANPELDYGTVGTRRVATGTFLSLSSTNLLLSQDPSEGNGGTCGFDSGGPILFAGTNLLSSQTQSGDEWCLLTNDTFRLDTADAQDFLSAYVAIPSKVPVCHKGHKTKEVKLKKLGAHLQHGDSVGACPKQDGL